QLAHLDKEDLRGAVGRVCRRGAIRTGAGEEDHAGPCTRMSERIELPQNTQRSERIDGDAALPLVLVAVPERPDRLLGADGHDDGVPGDRVPRARVGELVDAAARFYVTLEHLTRRRQSGEMRPVTIRTDHGPTIGHEPGGELATDVACHAEDDRGFHTR